MQRHQIIAMESYVATDQRPLDKCLTDIAACDIYVGIVAWRYGYIPTKDNPDKLSITEREFREAVKSGRHCLVFLLHEDAPWPRIHIESGRGRKCIEAFRRELATNSIVSFFRTAEELLAGLVSVAVSNWEYAQTPPGIDPKAWQYLLEQLAKQNEELQQKEEEIKEWVRKYHEIDQRLATEEHESSLARRVRILLHEGLLEEAGALLDQVLESGEAAVERLASHHFSRARVLDLQFQPLGALPHYAKAYQYRPETPTYAGAYANALQEQNRYSEAEPIYVAALQTLRSQAEANPAAFLPDVAMTLNNLGLLYKSTQQLEQAEAVYQEALTTYRQLAEANPAAFLPNITTVLNNLGVLYKSTQRLEQAEVVYQEALTILRQLAEANPAAFLPDVAMALNNLGLLYENKGQLDKVGGLHLEAQIIREQCRGGAEE
jgi:tetratricopeptide (TPR) repeat protein